MKQSTWRDTANNTFQIYKFLSYLHLTNAQWISRIQLFSISLEALKE